MGSVVTVSAPRSSLLFRSRSALQDGNGCVYTLQSIKPKKKEKQNEGQPRSSTQRTYCLIAGFAMRGSRKDKKIQTKNKQTKKKC